MHNSLEMEECDGAPCTGEEDNLRQMKSEARVPPFQILVERPRSTSITTVRENKLYNYVGPIHSYPMLYEAASFVAENSDARTGEAKEALRSFLHLTLKDWQSQRVEKMETVGGCLTIRMTKPSTYFRTPRWHRDGRMFPYDDPNETHSRYVTALLGPQTRILIETPTTTEMVNYKRGHQSRTALAEILAEQDEVEIGKGRILRFTCGQLDSPVHSEPDITTSDRVFVSILYGSEAEMTRLCEYRGKCTGKVWREQQEERYRSNEEQGPESSAHT